MLQLDRIELAEGRDLLIAGPSGCGNTTLLHLIAGLLAPSAGRVIVDGQDLGELSPAARDRLRGRRIGIVLQQFHLPPTITAMQSLLVVQSVAGLPVDRSAATSVLSTLGIDERIDACPHHPSVGQQQARRHRPRVRTAALSRFIALYHALNERARHRRASHTRGAPRADAMMLILEALTLAAAGGYFRDPRTPPLTPVRGVQVKTAGARPPFSGYDQ